MIRLNRKKLSFAQKKCVSTTGMLMQKTRMLHPGARVGIAVSGGVDSMALLATLIIRRAIMPFDVELMVLHLNPGFDPGNHAPLARLAKEWGFSAHLEGTDHGPRAHSDENKKNSACFYCAMLRRKRLFELAAHYNLTHLAFGHNLEDLAATFAMNLTRAGRVDGLSANEPFFNGALSVIRPMLLVEKTHIKAAARQWGLPVWDNPCPSAGSTTRDTAYDWLASAWSENKRAKSNILGALARFQLDADMKKFIDSDE